MLSARWTSSLLILALLLGPALGYALAASGDTSPTDRNPLGEPFEEDVEKESKSELETDDDDTSMLVVAPLSLSAGRTPHHLNEERSGTVASATHELHAPRAPPATV